VPDAIVIGGGLVVSAIAGGLQQAGLRTALLDSGDLAFRASRGNVGLVWVPSGAGGVLSAAIPDGHGQLATLR
jgi:glycine/D-amino acid oxidase-like deaminating enzyme